MKSLLVSKEREKVNGTDWALVSTNDGKKYYYNTRSEISSWQVPLEVTELRKKQESDNVKENSISVPNSNELNEKGSISLSAPALNTGGRDAIALRTSGAPGSSSALDLIKKKLQESGAAQVTSFSTTSSGSTLLEVNGSKSVESTAKGLQSEGNKDKPRDSEGDGNISESSSDSEDEYSGPTKEERIAQFKRCAHDFRALLTEVITPEAAAKETEDGRTVVSSWSTAQRFLKSDPRYSKMPRKDREAFWKRLAEEMQRKPKDAAEQKGEKHNESKNRNSNDSARPSSASRSGLGWRYCFFY